jgi:hypothetical protein
MISSQVPGTAVTSISTGVRADQSHMIREFTRVAGQSPEDFFRPLNASPGGLMQFSIPIRQGAWVTASDLFNADDRKLESTL